MAANKYRISIPMSLEAKHAIEELSKVTGASFGSTAASFLDELAPSILKLAEMYREVKTNPAKGAEMANLLAEEAQTKLREEQLKLLKKVNK